MSGKMKYGEKDKEFNERCDLMDYEYCDGRFDIDMPKLNQSRILDDKKLCEIFNKINNSKKSSDCTYVSDYLDNYKKICQQHKDLEEGELYKEVLTGEGGIGRYGTRDLMVAQTPLGSMVRVTKGDERIYLGNMSYKDENGNKQKLFVCLDQTIYEEDHFDQGLYGRQSWVKFDEKSDALSLGFASETLFRHLDTKFKQAISELRDEKAVRKEIYKYQSTKENG